MLQRSGGGDVTLRAEQGLRRWSGAAELTTKILTPEDARDLVERMLQTSGRRVDLSKPTF